MKLIALKDNVKCGSALPVIFVLIDGETKHVPDYRAKLSSLYWQVIIFKYTCSYVGAKSVQSDIVQTLILVESGSIGLTFEL